MQVGLTVKGEPISQDEGCGQGTNSARGFSQDLVEDSATAVPTQANPTLGLAEVEARQIHDQEGTSKHLCEPRRIVHLFQAGT